MVLLQLIEPSKLVRPSAPNIVLHVRNVVAPAQSQAVVTQIQLDPHVTPPTIEIVTPMIAAKPTPPCAVLDALSDALMADAATAIELEPVAAGPGHALMAWDGHWSSSPATASLRKAVTASIAAQPELCLDEGLVGPRLIFVPVSGITVSIGFGSGTWRWRQLLFSDEYRRGATY